MKITEKALKRRRAEVERLIIESVDLSLYLARAVIAGEEYLIADRDGKFLKTHNLLAMKRRLKQCVDCEIFLRQQSAYDEMVGHSYAASANTMEVSLGAQPLPEWTSRSQRRAGGPVGSAED